MKKLMSIVFILALTALVACGGGNNENNESQTDNETKDNAGGETIVFGQTEWTSTKAPTQIAKQILEEAGFDVKITLLSQPLIFEGLKSEEIDVFMDAWLPHTELFA